MKINNITTDNHPFLQIAAAIAKAPKSLYLLGNLPPERRPTVAIIGTRKPSAYGREVGYKLAFELARQGVVIVSGLALGIDSIAHQAALDAGGTTIAILPCGLDTIAPRSHRDLAIHILSKGGALLSEYPAGVSPRQWTFVERNRIVAGISDGLLVIEASAKSGTMHTAAFALEEGRAVMAVPGNITNPMSQGCNNLIKTGARPITNTDDVLHEIGYTRAGEQQRLPLAQNAAEYVLLQLLAAGMRDGDELHSNSKLEPAVFSQTLTMLEVTGRIRPLGGNQWALT